MENFRYDRQVRLWGDQGQNSIGQTNVCVLGSTSIATEILKNLVLAGIKSFHIIDDAKISCPDLGQNFFIRESDLGKCRAAVVTELLLDLNSAVKGTYSLENVENFSTYEYFLDFSVVISTNLIENGAILLSEYLVEHEIPFIYARVCGMFGYLHLSFNQHIVWNNHNTENSPHDFRLDFPFKELLDLSDSIDLDKLTHEQHSHIPYIIIYIKALEIWRSENAQILNGNLATSIPTNYQQRKTFEKVLMSLRKADNDGNLFEENFHEAKLNLFKTFGRSSQDIPKNLSIALNDPKAGSPEQCKSYLESTICNHYNILRPFWILTAALNKFINLHKHLPLSGQLPDMTSFSESYAKIVDIFKLQASREAYELFEIAKFVFEERQILLKAIFLANNSSMASENSEVPSFEESRMSFTSTNNEEDLRTFENSGITLELCKQFCKNASKIELLNGRSLKEEYTHNMENVLQSLTKPTLNENGIYEADPKTWFVLLRAMDRFYNEKDRFPGTNGVPCFIDSQDLRRRVTSIFAETKNCELMAKEVVLIPPFTVDEICRYGAAELHVISAIFGGIVAQEAIKLVTQQYIPVNNAIIFDGHTQTSKYV